jgi:flagellar basal-body rod modification protein FlgD
MDVSSLLDVSSSRAAATTPNAFSDLTSEQFVKIMFTELTKQDPTKPTDSNTLLQQMSSLRTIQSSLDLSRQIDSLVSQNQFAAAATMIGRRVEGLDDLNFRAVGRVVSVSRTADGPVLRLETGQRMRFDKVDTMIDATSA